MRQAREQSPHSGLRTFGEMVGLLWKAGRYSAAVRLEQMPPEISELMRLRFDARLTYSDIAGRLGMTADSARKLLTRTLRLLGDELED